MMFSGAGVTQSATRRQMLKVGALAAASLPLIFMIMLDGVSDCIKRLFLLRLRKAESSEELMKLLEADIAEKYGEYLAQWSRAPHIIGIALAFASKLIAAAAFVSITVVQFSQFVQMLLKTDTLVGTSLFGKQRLRNRHKHELEDPDHGTISPGLCGTG